MTNLFGLIWKAEYYSRHFCFTAYGLTDKQALDSLYMGLDAHREKYNLTDDWFDKEDINHEALRGEPLCRINDFNGEVVSARGGRSPADEAGSAIER